MTDSQEFLERVSRLAPKRLALLALDLQSKLDSVEASRDEPIAIVGMGCRFPGGVNDPVSYWQMLRDGVDAIREIPADRWDVDALFDPDPEAPDKIATRWGGFVDGIDQFDPNAFGISPREAVSMDPQQRLLLEVGWEALEHAGYATDALADSPTGIFVGICNGDYYQMLMDSDPAQVDAYAATGSAHSVASGRLSYLLGLRGPSLSVDTACSSSLVSVHLAVQSLQAGECRMALAGGVNAILAPRTTIALSRSKMMAADGRCKAFDASADGFVRSEGCGLVVLKRMSDAQADGDRILALIRGSAVNQDGRSNGLTAPNGPSQVAVIRQAVARAGVKPSDVGYVETHGTGTSLGDPIEVQALAAALGAERTPTEPLMLGSVKTNMGHLESAAGIAGLIKAVLMLQNGQVPPHLHLRTPNPHIAWDELPVAVPTQLTNWQPRSGRRIAGVSSFGFSGTNAHIILEEAAAPASDLGPEGPRRSLHLLSLSAKTEHGVRELAGRYSDYLAEHPLVPLVDVTHTANTSRARFGYRLGVVGADAASLGQRLARLSAGADAADVVGSALGLARGRPRVGFLFTGHGALSHGAGRRLWETQPVFHAALERCARFADAQLDKPLLAALYPHLHPEVRGADLLLDDMTYAQPALFALQYALASMWQAWGVTPNLVSGHSAGEYAAACVAGILSVEDGLTLTMARGRLMRSLPPTGQMATVLAAEATVRTALAEHGDGRVTVAAINGSASIVISGDASSVQTVVEALQAEGVETRALQIPLAAHSPHVDPILDAFERVAAGVRYAAPGVALVSTLTGELATGDDCASAAYWRRHLRQPVQFARAMQTLHKEGCEVFLEIGPRATLLGSARASLADGGANATWLPSLRPDHDDWEQVLDSLASLFVAGVDVDFDAFDRGGRDWGRLALPTYPFQRKRYWIAPARVSAPAPVAGGHPVLGQRIDSPALDPAQILFAAQLSADWPPYLDHHRVHGVCLVPAPVFVAMALEAATSGLGWGQASLEDLSIESALIIPDAGARSVQLVLDTHGEREARFRIFSRDSTAAATASTWTLHAAGRVLQAGAAHAGAPGDMNAVRTRCAELVDGTAYYERLFERGLEFGPYFRGISRLWRGQGEALAEVSLPDTPRQATDAYRFHPAFLDACFHVLGASVPDTLSEPQAYLLIGIDALTFYRTPGDRVWSHAELRPGAEAGSEALNGDIHVYDDDGALVAEISGLHLRRAAPAALRRGVQHTPADWLYETAWQPKPLPYQPEWTPSAAHWLILADDQGVGAQLAALVRARGERCDVATSGPEFEELSPGNWRVDPAAERDLQRLVLEIFASEASPVRRVVHLWGLDAPRMDDSVPARAAGLADSTLQLAQALARLPGSAQLWVVTRDAQPVPSSSAVTDPASSTVWGLGRVIALEHPLNWGGLIDLASDQSTLTAASLLLEEISHQDGEDQVALRGQGQRYVPRLKRASSGQARSSDALTFHPEATYLVTGGLGGLGLKLARWMAENGARHLTLIGRTGLPERRLWDELPAGSAPRRQIDAVREIEALGATVSPINVDVADRSQMQERLFDRFGRDLPPLRGIVHAAADLSGWSIADMPRLAMSAMLRPKIDGAWVLHELTRETALDFFVLFSSTTALWGAQKLAHYAAANSFLDAFAHYRRALGLTGLSVNWGTWDEMRAATMEDRQSYQQFGLSPMPSALALATLGELLSDGEITQRAVAAVDWRSLKPLYEARRDRPFLAEVGPPPASPSGPAVRHSPQHPSLLAQLEATNDPSERTVMVQRFLGHQAATVLRLEVALEPVELLGDFGLDSLMAVELKNSVETHLGVVLPMVAFLQGASIARLAEQVLERLVPRAPAVDLEPDQEIVQTNGAGSLLAEIDALSPEQVDALLRELLAKEEVSQHDQ